MQCRTQSCSGRPDDKHPTSGAKLGRGVRSITALQTRLFFVSQAARLPDHGLATDKSSVHFIPANSEKLQCDTPSAPNRQPGGRSGDRAAACGLDSARHKTSESKRSSKRSLLSAPTANSRFHHPLRSPANPAGLSSVGRRYDAPWNHRRFRRPGTCTHWPSPPDAAGRDRHSAGGSVPETGPSDAAARRYPEGSAPWATDGMSRSAGLRR